LGRKPTVVTTITNSLINDDAATVARCCSELTDPTTVVIVKLSIVRKGMAKGVNESVSLKLVIKFHRE
jgi:metal-sulfur cluster biosynthetic enzyme